jgi:hypothetical protein
MTAPRARKRLTQLVEMFATSPISLIAVQRPS